MSEKTTIEEPKGHLIAYAFEWLAEWSGHKDAPLPEGLPAGSRRQLEPYRMLLAGKWPSPDPGDPLLSIFSRVEDPQGKTNVPCCYWSPGKLDLQKIPTPKEDADPSQATLKSLWDGFKKEAAQVLSQPLDAGARFETFTHLLHKWAWAVPCRYGEPGVSLYEEFRALSALVHASHCTTTPAGKFLLVGGDIPGIQKTIYTITSKGAAKGLRGRSFFIQLLGDAVVRWLLDAWHLPGTNVVYAAGGNFMLLAPAQESAEVVWGQIDEKINRTLLDIYEGDMVLCLASVTVPADAIGTAEFGTDYSLELKRAIARKKAQWFIAIANKDDGWTTVFVPEGDGGGRVRFCAVCHAELNTEEMTDPELVLGDVTDLDLDETAPRACSDCATFRKLAEMIGRPHQALYLRRDKGLGERWQELLYELSGGWWYRFAHRTEKARRGESKLVLNDVGWIDHSASGFLFLANTTPRVTPADAAWWNETYPDQRNQIQVGSIRSFELLAQTAKRDKVLGRVGVLRMDVDDLGRVMTQGLSYEGKPHRSMAATSALSTALGRFFAGYLDVLCREVTVKPEMAGCPGHEDEGLLYVIYAGGDDLFVVGAWHLLPLLAQRVKDAFAQYVGGNPSLHISAGITLEDAKFPLYQAATRADKALNGGAKKHKYTENGMLLKKNAVHFLGQTLGWDEWGNVRAQTDKLVRLLRQDHVSRGLLQTLQMIYNRFLDDQKRAIRQGLKGEQIYYGPWMWRQAYYLKRFAHGKPESVQSEIEALHAWTLKPQRIQYLGLVARWAEYLLREEKVEN